MLLSICIPSWNRGDRAFSLVKKCLALDSGEDEIEIICSNNGSTKYTQEYRNIAGLAGEYPDGRLRYYEFSENQGFTANLNQVLKLSQGEFSLLISDEDEIVPENLQHYMMILKEHPEISIMQGRTSRMYHHIRTCFCQTRKECLHDFYLRGNYISGRIYNRHVITDALIDTYAHDYAGEEAYKWYPHMFLDAYALTHGCYCISDPVLIMEGPEADTYALAEDPDLTISAYGTYESRLLQLHGYVRQIHDLGLDPGIQFQMLIRAFECVSVWILAQKDTYESHHYEWGELVGTVKSGMKEDVRFLGLPFGEEDIQTVYEVIDLLME